MNMMSNHGVSRFTNIKYPYGTITRRGGQYRRFRRTPLHIFYRIDGCVTIVVVSGIGHIIVQIRNIVRTTPLIGGGGP